MKMNFNRRRFIKTGAMATAGLTFIPSVLRAGKGSQGGNPVRLGGPVEGIFADPADWVKTVRSGEYDFKSAQVL